MTTLKIMPGSNEYQDLHQALSIRLLCSPEGTLLAISEYDPNQINLLCYRLAKLDIGIDIIFKTVSNKEHLYVYRTYSISEDQHMIRSALLEVGKKIKGGADLQSHVMKLTTQNEDLYWTKMTILPANSNIKVTIEFLLERIAVSFSHKQECARYYLSSSLGVATTEMKIIYDHRLLIDNVYTHRNFTPLQKILQAIVELPMKNQDTLPTINMPPISLLR